VRRTGLINEANRRNRGPSSGERGVISLPVRRGKVSSSVRRGMRLVLALCLLALASCAAPQPKGQVIVYVAAPLSGWQADGGQTVVGGVRLMAERLNASGGLLGYEVRVLAMDDEADSDVAVQVAEQIRQAIQRGERIIGIVGHYNSGQSLAAMEIYKDLPLVVVTPTASDVSLTQKGYTNFFRVNATDAAQGPTQAQAVQQIKEVQPDAVFLAGYETEGYVLLPELREAGVTVPFMASDGCFLYEFIDGAGPAAEGAYVSGITPDHRVTTDAQWWKEYQELEARNPGTYSIAGYSAMEVIAEGVKKAGTFSASQVAEAIRNLDFQSLVGRISYNAAGDLREQRVYIFQVRDGDFSQVAAE
jgi:branched-chain amino acid transport system substrate-binding protein